MIGSNRDSKNHNSDSYVGSRHVHNIDHIR